VLLVARHRAPTRVIILQPVCQSLALAKAIQADPDRSRQIQLCCATNTIALYGAFFLSTFGATSFVFFLEIYCVGSGRCWLTWLATKHYLNIINIYSSIVYIQIICTLCTIMIDCMTLLTVRFRICLDANPACMHRLPKAVCNLVCNALPLQFPLVAQKS